MRRYPKGSRQKGFTLLETLAALGVFAIVTLGVVPLLGAALRGTSLSRSETVSENTARQMMERVQGLKWFTSWNSKAEKVDLLDLFYPSLSSNAAMGQSYSATDTNPPLVGNGGTGTQGGIFTTTCPPPTTPNPACAGVTLPSGYTMTIKAAFVKAVTGSSPQTYQIVTPPTSPAYAYNSTTGADAPPAQLMDVDVAVNWTVNGRARTFRLRSIIGEHHFVAPAAVVATGSPSPTTPPGATKIRAVARLDYILRVQNGFSSSSAGTGCATPPCSSDLDAIIGNSESDIEAGDNTTADSVVRMADLSIARSYPTPQVPPPTPPPDLSGYTGITATVHAPPTAANTSMCLPAPPNCNTDTIITHPDFSGPPQVGSVGGTKITAISADVSAGIPTTTASFQLNNACGSVDSWFNNNQADLAGSGFLRLNSTVTPIRNIRTNSDPSCTTTLKRNKGTTTATSTALTPTSSRKVQATVSARLYQLGMLQTNWITSPINHPFEFTILDWSALLDCKSTPNGGAYAVGGWSATGLYYFDANGNGSTPDASPRGATIAFNSPGNDTITAFFNDSTQTVVTTPNAIDWLKANNPLIYDGNGLANEIYLFDDPAAGKKGYFTGASEYKPPGTGDVSTDGRTTSHTMDAALRFDTNQLSATAPDTAYNISIGKMSCEAVDNR
jgi:prepilin-type N-terminal cleavage/methylation domain-containing protein